MASKSAISFSSLFFAALLIISCNEKKSSSEIDNVENKVPNIKATYSSYLPHDTTAFTEGFFVHNGEIYESTGSPENLPFTRSLFGTVNPQTGEINAKGELDKQKYFGEGIAILDDKLFQLTYKSRKGFIYDAKTFDKIQEFEIPSKEGWGLTTDGEKLIMSDGTNKLMFINPESLKVVKTLNVTENGLARDNLNELEYINGYIYANIWRTNSIVKIDLSTGRVIGKLNLTDYANEAKNIYPRSLEMNGIAYNPETGKILVTGKLWPKIYELKIDLGAKEITAAQVQ